MSLSAFPSVTLRLCVLLAVHFCLTLALTLVFVKPFTKPIQEKHSLFFFSMLVFLGKWVELAHKGRAEILLIMSKKFHSSATYSYFYIISLGCTLRSQVGLSLRFCSSLVTDLLSFLSPTSDPFSLEQGLFLSGC